MKKGFWTNPVVSFIKRNSVAVIAFVAAVVTVFIVPPDAEYAHYIDFKTLSCLFAVLAVVSALKGVRFFFWLSYKVILLCKNMRLSALALVYITFIGSMLIANDMALITFLPLGFMVLSVTHKEKYMARLFILQNIAANLGGMLTPFGNPQNLYLYSRFNIPDGQFLAIMAPSFLLSIVLFSAACILFFKPEELTIPKEEFRIPMKRTIFYLVLFAVAIIMVFRILPFYVGLAIVFAALLFTDREALKRIDMPLSETAEGAYRRYTVNESGKELLDLYGSRIPFSAREAIDRRLPEWREALRTQRDYQADMAQTPRGDFEVSLRMMERGRAVMSVSVSLPSSEIAARLCKRWQCEGGEVFRTLLRPLLEDGEP